MGTFRETREVERELANDYGFDADRMVEVDEGDFELRDMARDSRSNISNDEPGTARETRNARECDDPYEMCWHVKHEARNARECDDPHKTCRHFEPKEGGDD